MIWKVVRNTPSQVTPQATELETGGGSQASVLTSTPGESDVH